MNGVGSNVGRTAIHVGEHLEHLYELIVPEFDRGIVFQHGRILEPDDIHCIEIFFQFRIAPNRSEAFEYGEEVVCRFFASGGSKCPGKFGLLSLKLFLQGGDVRLAGLKGRCVCFYFHFLLFDIRLQDAKILSRFRQFLQGE